MNKKLYIKTWGCQMNTYDSDRMADILHPLGYRRVEGPEDADMVILNTCHIREKATDKVFSDLGRIRQHKEARKREGKATLVAVAGCVAQAEGDVILERAPYVDMVFGPQSYHTLPEMIVQATGQRVINTEFPPESKFDSLPEERAAQEGPAAFLSIQEGCDKFCTFCVVPYTRGAEHSRPSGKILDEAKTLRDRGVVEIVLLGQNVNAYHDTGVNGLGGLIAAVAEIDGIERIRYMTSHPRDMDDGLIAAHGDISKLMPFLHLPVQSGADDILKTMNRKHTADHYRDIIARVRKVRPDIALSSDFIVGFPGESERHFEETLQLIRDIGFTTSYSFKFSARPGTPAANMQGLVPEKIKDERVHRIQALLYAQHNAFNASCIGRTMDVLFDGHGRVPGQLHARTPYNQAIHVIADETHFGRIVPVKITASSGSSLTGELS